ncbi:hypothetical protein CH286_05525 [Rhodococcus sp. WWJCD1]|uniref:glycosyltransferase n=1 Tax=Rhodococcus sp. WWJCD1 TaxID=2022519 RepID=UPI000B9ABFB5|nr:glycosyltransferase [Rhodococcus sp. WWJCD1]OZC51000.1 hypothetical protein CH286_05525 [Rhodococcus sp. WWJCD1]
MKVKKILYLTTYEQHRHDLGGAAWVDGKVLEELQESFQVIVFPVVNAADESPVPLEVRGRFNPLLRTAWQMLAKSQCYQEAKFKWSSAWDSRKDRLLDAIDSFKPDIIVTSQWPALLMAVDSSLENVVHIAHNVDSVLSELYDPVPLRAIKNAERMLSREKQLLQTCAKVLAISATDAERIRGWGIQVSHLKLKVSSCSKMKSGMSAIGFIGKASWPPNKDAVTNLVQTVMPEVREQMPVNAPTLVIAGRGSEMWEGSEGVRVLGQIDDLDEFYSQIDLVVVPRTSQTTGISIKMLEAVERGVTVISTGIMAEDAGLSAGFIGADTIADIVQNIVRFYSDDSNLDNDTRGHQSESRTGPSVYISDTLHMIGGH